MGLFDLFQEHHLVGLDIGVSGIKAVELSGRKNPRLVAYNRLPLPWDTIGADGEIHSRQIVVGALKKLFEFRGFTTKRVAIGATGNSIMTKKISVPRMTSAELSHQLYWEAEQYIPFNINDVNLDFAILGNSSQPSSTGAPQMDVLLVAAKRDYVDNLTSIAHEAGLECEVVDNQAFALGNAFEFNYGHQVDTSPGGATNVILDFGAGTTKFSVVEGDKTTFTRELRQSGMACTLMLAERLGISPEEAEKTKIMESESGAVRAVVGEHVHGLVEEISRTLDFYMTQSHEKAIQGIYLCGGASRVEGLVESLEAKMPSPVMALNPVQNIAGSGRKMNAQAIREIAFLGAVAIGLSLRVAGDAG